MPASARGVRGLYAALQAKRQFLMTAPAVHPELLAGEI
jgi:hypothetical protein